MEDVWMVYGAARGAFTLKWKINNFENWIFPKSQYHPVVQFSKLDR
jgi:hypothetical protein